MIPVSDIEITVHRTRIEIDVKAHIRAGRYVPGCRQGIIQTRLHRAVIARLTVFLHHQVNDAGCSFGRKLSRRVGDQLNLLNRSRRHLLQHLRTVLAVQSGRFTVDPDLHVLAVTQTDVTFLIHVHRRDVLQHVRHTCTRRCDVLIHREHFLVQLKTHRAALSDHLHVLQHLRVLTQRNTTDVHRLTGNHQLFLLLRITHERHHQRVVAVLELECELTRLIRDRTRDQIITLHHAYIREINRLLRAEVHDLTCYFNRIRANRNDQQ